MTICTVAHICTHWFKHSMKKNGSECSCSFSQNGGYDISRSCKMKNHLRPMNENKPCWKPWIICIRSNPQPFLMDLPKKMKSEHWTYPFYRQENTLSLTSMLHLGFKENWQMDNLLWTHNVVPREIEVL